MNKLTVNKVSQALDVTAGTINNWYRWYQDDRYEKPEGIPELPKYEQAYNRAPRYWKESDIEKLKIFQAWLPKGRGGVMGEYNARYWGDRGIRALENKENL